MEDADSIEEVVEYLPELGDQLPVYETAHRPLCQYPPAYTDRDVTAPGPYGPATDSWWVWDLSVMPPRDKQIAASVRGEGRNVYVVVEDAAWGHSVDERVVANLIQAWDEGTPSDPEHGIYDQVTGLFGDPPDEFDNDPKVYLFLYEMGSYNGHGFDGYFKVEDQLDVPVSNRHETLHINTLHYAPDSDYMLSVQAHELQHLIHWGHDREEENWLNEAMSEVAMVVTGYGADEKWVDAWLRDPSHPLIPDGIGQGHYGLYMLFGDYLWERFGDDFIKDLTADPLHGKDSLDAKLGDIDSTLDLDTVYADLGLAIAVNDTSFEGGVYGFERLDIGEVKPTELSDGGASYSDVSGRGGMSFMKAQVKAGRTVQVESALPEGLRLRAAVVGPSGPVLVADTLNGGVTDIDIREDGTLWLAVTNISGEDASFSARFKDV